MKFASKKSGNIAIEYALATAVVSMLGFSALLTYRDDLGCFLQEAGIRLGSSSAISCVDPVPDRSPEVFTFIDNATAGLDAVIFSNAITITGINAPTSVSIYGEGSPEFSVNGGPWTTSGNILNNQTLQVRLRSSSLEGVEFSAHVNVGGQSDIFNVTTGDGRPQAFAFTDQTGVSGGAIVTSNAITLSGMTLPGTATVSGDGSPQISVNSGPWVSSATVSNGDSLAVRLTSASGTNGGTHSATVDVSGQQGTFSVTTIDTTPDAYAWTDLTGQVLNTTIASNVVTMAGLTAPAAVSVSGDGNPQISINGGPWVASGTVSNGGTIAVRLTSASSTLTARSATVNVGGVSDTFTVTTGNNQPQAFAFTDQTGVSGGAIVTSNAITLSGMTLPGTATVSGNGSPQISVNSGPWVSSATVSNGDSLVVRLTSASGTNGGTHSAIVDVSGRQDTFSVTTQDITPSAYSWSSQTGQSLSTLVQSNTITINGFTDPVSTSVSGNGSPQISINGGSWTSSGTVTPGSTVAVRLTSSSSYSTTHTATVYIGSQSGSFSVSTESQPSTPSSSACPNNYPSGTLTCSCSASAASGTFGGWGTDMYTNDSPVCAAAVHAGMIPFGVGGTVTVVATSGQSSYTGSTRNGVTTNSYGSWGGSFYFIQSSFPDCPNNYPSATTTCNCTASAASATFGGWGTNFYTNDSPICAAAVHAGRIPFGVGGVVTVVPHPDIGSYTGSTQNGVTTNSYGAWNGSFYFQ